MTGRLTHPPPRRGPRGSRPPWRRTRRRREISQRVLTMESPARSATASTCSTVTQLVTGDGSALVGESLVGVHHAGEVDARRRGPRPAGPRRAGRSRRERRGAAMSSGYPSGARRTPTIRSWAGWSPGRAGSRARAHARRRRGPSARGPYAHRPGVDRAVSLRRGAQRVSRCAVCLRQRGQNFSSSMRSGSLRRFFLVM